MHRMSDDPRSRKWKLDFQFDTRAPRNDRIRQIQVTAWESRNTEP
jgi:hypothetical protein